MVPKRSFPDEDDNNDFEVPLRDSKRRSPLFRTVVRDGLTRGLSLEAVWEPFLRRVVQDEAERVIRSFFGASSSHSVHRAGPSRAGSGLQLQFVSKLPAIIFTGGRIEAEGGKSVEVILMDVRSQTIVNSGPLSSIKIEIVALNGEFGSEEREDWTEKEFNDSILREREGRRPLVTGELTLSLKEGVGRLGNIILTDNSSWIRSRKFRLGVRVVQKIPGEVRIQEAISEPFVVKDHRGESYKKHHPPHLDDEVWRLEKIAKDGALHKRLASCSIRTVKDFLRMYMRDPTALRDAIQNRISNKTWKVIIQHALQFVDDNKLFAYHRPEQGVVVCFNSIYKVEGAIFNGQYCPANAFTTSQKALVDNLKHHAYGNVGEIVPMDASIAGPPRPLASPQVQNFNNDPIQHDFLFVNQDQQPIELGLSQSTTSSSFPGGSSEGGHQLVVPAPQNNHPSFVFPPSHRNSFSMEDFSPVRYTGEPSWFPSGLQGPIVPTNLSENLFQVQSSPTFTPTTTWEQGGPSFFFDSNTDNEEEGISPSLSGFVHMSRDRRHKASWCKIRAAFKCWLSVKLAARRMARPVYVGY